MKNKPVSKKLKTTAKHVRFKTGVKAGGSLGDVVDE